MKRLITVFAILLSAVAVLANAQRVDLGNFAEDVKVTVLESNDQRTVIKFEVGAFTKQPVEIQGETYFIIRLTDEGVLLKQGEPALPRICRSIIIPDNAKMESRVIRSEYRDFYDFPIAPSKGNLKRTVNPADIPYEFGPVYNTDDWYPSKQESIREPFIMRDIRGIVTEIYPFQYNPINKTLRVYTSITIEIDNVGPGEINVLERDEPLNKVNPEFNLIYKKRFINYEQSVLLYTPVEEIGDMLVVTYDAFHDAMMPFVEWKNQKGIKTTIVDVSEIGNNSSLIDNFVQAFYDSTDLAFLVLVGDAAQVATPYAWGGASDPSYSKVAGGDNYPDIFVGRFSAENLSHVETQVTRSLEYEMYPQTSADWYHKATGIASAEGPGHHQEDDWEHMELIRGDLLGYNYTLVDPLYDPGVNAADVAQVLDEGRGFVNYCGHGYIQNWGTSDFTNANVNALINDNMLPFVFSVACNNGEFDDYTCFAEAWMRATHDGEPTGAIATYMSSISQDWDPPMYAQDEAVDLLVSESKLTFGGLCYNGSCLMIEVQDAGAEMFDTWIFFGDPSIMIYTVTPTAMTVDHSAAMLFTQTQFDVSVPGIEGALCALYHDGVLYGSAYTDDAGEATIDIELQTPIGQTLNLTVTSYNKEPYVGEVTVISPDGPYMVFDECAVNDEAGNNDGLIDFGESVLLDMQLMNVGPDSAYNVWAVLSTDDELVTITDNHATFGDVEGDFGTISLEDAYAFDVSNQTQDGHQINFELTISNETREEWTGSFRLPVHAPVVNFVNVFVDDSEGNNNGIIEAGETVEVEVIIQNDGSCRAVNVIGVISTDDEYVTVDDDNSTFGDIAPDATGDNSSNRFVVTAQEDFPPGYAVTFGLAISADGGYTNDLHFTIRAIESFEYSAGGYVGEGVWEWGAPTSGPGGAFDGDNVWGTVLGGQYVNNADDDLVTTLFALSDNASFSFNHWYIMESGYNDYDGGNVQVSIDNGNTWQVVSPDGGYPSSSIIGLDGEPGFTGESGGWRLDNFDLSAYAGQTVLIKFRFGSDGSVLRDGWYIDGVVMSGGTMIAPQADVTPSSFDIQININEISMLPITIANNGDAQLDFSVAVITDVLVADQPAPDEPINEPEMGGLTTAEKDLGIEPVDGAELKVLVDPPFNYDVITDVGGPDEFGYMFIDSDEENGPEFNWVDISGIGTIPTFNGSNPVDDGYTDLIPMGMTFEYYGQSYTEIVISTNGWVSFHEVANAYLSNTSIPNQNEPNAILAVQWDDLDGGTDGVCYYYYDDIENTFTVSWVNWHYYPDASTPMHSFQVILNGNDNSIIMQYGEISGGSYQSDVTVGIENETGTVGLMYAYNNSTIQPGLAIKYICPVFWLTVSPGSGSVMPGESMELEVTFDATVVGEGEYTGNIMITTNDPGHGLIDIPVILHVNPVGIDNLATIPIEFSLAQNYPNPFNPRTELAFGLPRAGHVKLEVFDIMGRSVITLIDEELTAGVHTIIWDGVNSNGEQVSSGMYFYKLNQGDNVITKKMMMLK